MGQLRRGRPVSDPHAGKYGELTPSRQRGGGGRDPRPLLYPLREPQWLGLSLPKNKRRGEERRRKCSTETYLCESALVQNSLLELRNFSRGYAARAEPPGAPEKAPSRRGQAGRLRETAIAADVVRQAPPLAEASRIVPDDPFAAGDAVTGSGPRGCGLRPPGENGPRP
jgi:hypothetical protein